MPNKKLASVAALLLAAGPGCLNLPNGTPTSTCSSARQEGPTIRVKAPPQKIVIEQPEECCPEEDTCPSERETKPPPKKEQGRPEASPRGRPEAGERRPSPEGAAAQPQAGALGTLATLGQIASFSRTIAMTNPLGTVNPGASALGLGIRWIHIPIPCPHLFTVQETPSVTVPLSEANLTAAGVTGVGPGLVAGANTVAGRGMTREEIAALIARELAAHRRQSSRQEAARCQPADDAERRRLEKKLADAEAQIEQLSKVLKALDDKIPDRKPAKDKDKGSD